MLRPKFEADMSSSPVFLSPALCSLVACRRGEPGRYIPISTISDVEGGKGCQGMQSSVSSPSCSACLAHLKITH